MPTTRRTTRSATSPTTRQTSGRHEVRTEDPVVVFLVGMRLNRPWKVTSWLPVLTGMPRMLAALARDPDSGLLGHRMLLGPGPGVTVVQYWRSLEHLHRFARAADAPHLPAWRRFNRTTAGSGDVGIWHEVYEVPAGSATGRYLDLPGSRLAGLAQVAA